jgi:hypothetical protein
MKILTLPPKLFTYGFIFMVGKFWNVAFLMLLFNHLSSIFQIKKISAIFHDENSGFEVTYSDEYLGWTDTLMKAADSSDDYGSYLNSHLRRQVP